MTARERRLRQLNTRLANLEREVRATRAELLPLENAESLSRGFRVPLRGERLIAEMDRDAGRAAA